MRRTFIEADIGILITRGGHLYIVNKLVYNLPIFKYKFVYCIPLFASTNVCLDQCLPRPMSASTNVCLDQCLPLPMSASTNVCLDQCLPRPMSALTNVCLDQYLPRPMSASMKVRLTYFFTNVIGTSCN